MLGARLLRRHGQQAWARGAGRRYSARIPESDRLSRMLLPTRKAAKGQQPGDGSPAQTTTDMLVKAGYVCQSSAGIYTLMPLAQRVVDKIEAIIDVEMRRVGGQKLAMPTLLSPENWRRTGRLDSTGEELFSFKDRRGSTVLLGPTHEEEVTAIVRDMVRSYRQYPLRLYQTTRKFRDEARPRAGLLRGREFIMKDMYSFDVTREQAIASFDALEAAYRRCFDRIGVPYAVADADSGNIGGSLSKEFHFVSGAGEDTLLACGGCGYTANEERAHSTAGAQCGGVGVYSVGVRAGGRAVARGRVVVAAEHEPSALKLRQALPVAARERLEIALVGTHGAGQGAELGRALAGDGPWFLDACAARRLPADSAPAAAAAATGDWHVARAGDVCGACGRGRLEARRAVEVGHIFYLGDKYSRALDLTTLHQGQRTHVQMGCYGIGVSRILQAVAECCGGGGRGLRWPLSIAPYRAVVVPLDGADRAGEVYAALAETRVAGVPALRGQVAVDDRDYLSAGFRLHDAQMLGIPVTVVMGRRFADESVVEVQLRVPMLALPAEVAGVAVEHDGHECRALVRIERLGEFLGLALAGHARQLGAAADELP
ncbi:hypothetical protein H4R18_000080 [Coemansia javaensis]|uniref:proline--tRNA ligase n=1 Tax=Coemansia javaensis TaxID=2761396 RepID=A0A9W8HQR3_9FUNG|nr:hypothetical protein H4R18_000080 [Coemansia javaensis]